MTDIKKMYRTIMADHFPNEMIIQFGDQTLVYKKRTWKILDDKTGELIEKGLRYGENPEQEAALYELVNGNLTLGGCQFIAPGNGLVSSITEEDMIQAGKHPGKTNLTDLDNGLNIIKYLMDRPAAAILKHNNPCGAAFGKTLADAYEKANMADRIAAFGGCLVVNTGRWIKIPKCCKNYLEVAAARIRKGTISILAKRKNLRIIRVSRIHQLTNIEAFGLSISNPDGRRIIVQQSPINKIKAKADFLPARTTYQGREYAIERARLKKNTTTCSFGWNEQGITRIPSFMKDGVTRDRNQEQDRWSG
jgi:phosphoribosylaminoimidazolecarboxamide formyltransferase/IMP cyclohydrolase